MTRPPRAATALLAAVLPAPLRDAVLGDLAEEFDARRASSGQVATAIWYWTQAAAIGLRVLHDRLRRLALRALGQESPRTPPKAGVDGPARGLAADLRFSLRHLRRNPAFTAVGTLVIALGIGVNTAILALANAAFVKALPYPQADRLGLLSMEFGGLNQGGFSVSYLDMEDVIAGATVFDDVALFLDWQSVNLSAGGEPQRVPVNFVTPNYFPLAGFRTSLGRTFHPGEDGAGAAASVAVLSHGIWKRGFGGDPHVLGRRVLLNDRAFTVIGVLDPAVRDLSHRFGHETAVYLPLMAAPPLTGLDITERRSARFLYALGRLKDGASLDAARAQLAAIGRRLGKAYPATNGGWTFLLRPLREIFFEESRTSVLVLLGGSVLMLALVCTSLMTLVLIQLAGRTPELSIRLALGASRGRVARLLITEAVCLAAIGGLCGIAVAHAATGFAGSLDVLALPGFSRLEIDGTVLLGALLLVLGVGLSLGIGPALHLRRAGTADLRDAGARHTDPARRRRAALVVAEVALASLLLVGAGLLIASFHRLRETGMGFDAGRLVSVRLDLRGARYDDAAVVRHTAQRLVEEAGAIPGVQTAFFWSPSRIGGGNWVFLLTREGEFDVDPLRRVEASRHHVAPGALRRLGIPLRAGRDFSATDHAGAPPVAIVSESLARLFWPGASPIGKRLDTVLRDRRLRVEVVGVAADARHRSRLNDPFGAQRDIYLPFDQAPERFLTLLLRHEPGADAGTVASAIRRRVLAVDPTLPVYDVLTIEQQMWQEESRARLSTLVVTGYAALALVLAVLGVYGVLAHMVRLERKEIGIRRALGATDGSIVRGVLGRGLRLVALGSAAGLGAALAGAQLLTSALFGIEPRDPLVFGLAALAMAVPALLACTLPAWHAARVSPNEALRT